MPNMRMTKEVIVHNGSIISAFFAMIPTACCVGPIAFSFFGVSSMALGTALLPYSLYFSMLTLVFLSVGFYFAYRPQKACAPDRVCANPKVRKRQRLILWGVTIFALVAITFPYILPYLPIDLFA